MKKLGVVLSVLLIWNTAFAQTTDNSLIDEVDKAQQKQLETVQEQFSFQAFESCVDMNSVLTDWIKKFENQYPDYRRGGIIETFAVDGNTFAPEDADFDDAAAPAMLKSTQNNLAGGADTEEVAFSETNLQKKGVDEPEIIKSNGEFLYYYNQQERKVSVIKTPLQANKSSFDYDLTDVLSEIAIPQTMNDVEMFLYGDKLVLAGTRRLQFDIPHSIISKRSRTVVAIYDMSDVKNPNLIKFHDIDGSLNNMRMIDNKLYVLTYLPLNWHQFFAYSWDIPEWLEASQQSLPKVYSVGADNKVELHTTDCQKVSYVMPSDETIKQSGLSPQFTMITALDIEKHDVETTIAFGNAWQIHMSADSLYMVQNHWVPDNYYMDCPRGMACIRPRMWGGEYSLIHKFAIDEMSVLYKNSNVVPGSMLTQYSMDEDRNGFFRILTSVWSPEQATNFYVLDNKLELEGKLEWIEPGERFQSSRYIGDKLYLVTFRQVDPLFVVDIANPATPKIIGELKIPGFSTYLHPMGGLENNKQYLIGLGHDADENGRRQGLQLSLYEVDYQEKETVESKCSWLEANEKEYNKCKAEVNPENIRVSQIDSLIQWGEGSRSEAMQNPRMFVMNTDFDVTLPMLLKEKEEGGQNCQVFYDANNKEVGKECYDIETYVTKFLWLKSFAFDKKDGIKEIKSVDYQEMLEKTMMIHDDRYNQGISSRQLHDLMMRVGFIGDTMYSINNDFAHFFNAEQERYLNFDPILQGQKVNCDTLDARQCEINPQCEAIRENPPCDAEACIEIVNYVGCREIE